MICNLKHSIYSLILSLAIYACSSPSQEYMQSQMSCESREHIIKIAKQDAQKAITANNERQREGAILEIKAKESQLRNAKLYDVADLYITTAHSLVDSLSNKTIKNTH